MSFDEETVMAYADGELDGAARAAVEAAMQSDPQLAQRIARHRALRERLRTAFDPVLDEPLPGRLLASLHAEPAQRRTDNVVTLPRRAAPRWSWQHWGAMAASLLIGALLGPPLLRSPQSAYLTRDGQLLAGGDLAHALSTQLAAGQTPAAPVQVGVSFRARGGAYCRTFTLRERGSLAGVACRDAQAWRVEALAQNPAPAGATGAYRPAASALPPAVARAVDALIAGEPLDAAGEAAARAAGWAH
jgi:anti-sigma factor RsiW